MTDERHELGRQYGWLHFYLSTRRYVPLELLEVELRLELDDVSQRVRDNGWQHDKEFLSAAQAAFEALKKEEDEHLRQIEAGRV